MSLFGLVVRSFVVVVVAVVRFSVPWFVAFCELSLVGWLVGWLVGSTGAPTFLPTFRPGAPGAVAVMAAGSVKDM